MKTLTCIIKSNVMYAVYVFYRYSYLCTFSKFIYSIASIYACGVMVIVVEIGHDDTSSNPGWGWLHFT